MADAYKVTKDITLPRAIRVVGEDAEGNALYENEGILYAEGSYVYSKDISPNVRERVENGEFEGKLEEASQEDADAYFAELNGVPRGTFVPEHEVEAEALLDAGHKIVDREEKLKLRSAGSEAAQQAQAEALEEGNDERAVTLESLPSTVQASNDGERIVPRRKDAEDQYVSAEDAGQIQTDPSGVVSQMPSEDKPRRSAPRRSPKPKDDEEQSS